MRTDIQTKIRNTFALRLQQLLISHNVLQKDVARDLGVDKTTFSSWCTGRRYPVNETLIRLADYFNVPVSYFGDLSLNYDQDNFDVSLPVDLKEVLSNNNVMFHGKLITAKEREQILLISDVVTGYTKSNYCVRDDKKNTTDY